MTSLISYLLSLVVKTNPAVRQNKHNIPLPAICHQEIPASVVRDRAVFVMGDIHGCLEEMYEMMEKVKCVESDPIFVFVGDLVNKGPYSVEVVKAIKEMSLSCNAYAVRGNHDESALSQLIKFRCDSEYQLPDKYEWIKGLNDEDVRFLSALPYTISIPCLNVLVVHGGLVPGKPLDRQKLNVLTNMRNVIDTGDPFESAGLIGYNKCDRGVAWAGTWQGPEHVYFGHDARRKLQLAQYATGLDTGCCYGEQLTGVFINKSRQRLTVKSKQTFPFDEELKTVW